MANGGRRVVIDDTHPSIVYSTNPAWILDETGVMDNVGYNGKSLNTTLHGTNANGSFSFNFSGTAIDVYGTNNIRNSSGVIDPLWMCYLNGVHIDVSPPLQYKENNQRMCGTDGLLDMNHTLTLSVSTSGQSFWFDYLVYTPSPNTSSSQTNSFIFVPFSDSALDYDSSWQYWSNLSIITRTVGATVHFQFTGSSISWYGIYPNQHPIRPALASFSVDGGTENTFHLQGLSSNASTAYNQLLFRTNVDPHGPHTLTVNFKGGNNTTPLSLAYILLQTDDSLGGNATTSASTLESGAGRPSINIAGLVCGVVALLVIIAGLLAYTLVIRKRKQTRTETSAFPVTADFDRPAPTVSSPRRPTAIAPLFDLASSTPYIGIEAAPVEVRSRRPTWHEELRTSLFAAFNRTPHLGAVQSNDFTTGHRRQRGSPQITSLWARRNRSRQNNQRLSNVYIPHRPRMPPHHGQEQGYQTNPVNEYPAPGHRDSEDDVVEDSVGNLPTASLSLPSLSAGHGRNVSSADASYYGGYRTMREMVELEKCQRSNL